MSWGSSRCGGCPRSVSPEKRPYPVLRTRARARASPQTAATAGRAWPGRTRLRLRWQCQSSWLDFPAGRLLHAIAGLVVLNAIKDLDAAGVAVDADEVAGA